MPSLSGSKRERNSPTIWYSSSKDLQDWSHWFSLEQSRLTIGLDPFHRIFMKYLNRTGHLTDLVIAAKAGNSRAEVPRSKAAHGIRMRMSGADDPRVSTKAIQEMMTAKTIAVSAMIFEMIESLLAAAVRSKCALRWRESFTTSSMAWR